MILLLILLFSGPASARDTIPRPESPKAVDGECAKTYPLRRGQPFPIPLADSSLATCSGVVVPLSDYADLLATEEWAKAVAAKYQIDTTLLDADLNWYKKRLEEESKPPPFLERPGTQRWFGSLETLVTVGVVAVGLSAAYQYGAGGFK